MRNYNPQGPRGGPGGPFNPQGPRGGPGQGVNTRPVMTPAGTPQQRNLQVSQDALSRLAGLHGQPPPASVLRGYADSGAANDAQTGAPPSTDAWRQRFLNPGPQGGILEDPGSKDAGPVSTQAQFVNFMAQAMKDRVFNKFNNLMKSLAIHPGVDSEVAKRIMPKYYQVFGSILEARAGKDMQPVMQSLLQHFYNSAKHGPRREEDGRR